MGEGTEDTRRRFLKTDLVTENHDQASIDAMVQLLADEKLIVTDRTQQGDEVIDVAHEALIRHWELLQQWLDESRQQLQEQRKIESLAQEWRDRGYKNEYLLQGRWLKECRQKQQYLTLSTRASEFLEKSAKHQLMSRVQAVGLFFIIPLMGTYLGLREIQLNADTKLLENCPEKQEYCPGRREALQRLVKASKSLAYFDLDNANLYKANLTNANLYKANLEDAHLDNANLRYAKVTNANLTNANLTNANLTNANLHIANLTNANLEDANLEDANLTYAKLRYANLYNANLEDANLYNANITPRQIKSTCNWDQAFYNDYWDKEKREWIIDHEANKAYIEGLKQDKASDPKTPPDCSKWE